MGVRSAYIQNGADIGEIFFCEIFTVARARGFDTDHALEADFAEFVHIDPVIDVPLGQGGVPFPAYLAALEDIGYRGYLTIEREVGSDPAGDILLAADFLRTLMK